MTPARASRVGDTFGAVQSGFVAINPGRWSCMAEMPDLRTPMRLCLALLVLLLVGCAARPRAVVVERSVDTRPPPAAPRSPAQPADYVVVRGDTLYAIAFRHGVDFHALARWNGIAAPYTIYPGQRLRLSGDGQLAQRPATPPPAVATAPKPPAGGVTAPDAPARPPVSAPSPTPAPAKPPAVAGSGGAVIWRWPTDGQLLSGFSAGDPTRQGIDIVGSAGQPVLAAADGEVVYSGAGLVGYGELIIIKHSDQWLSAYGHNRKRLVTEGQKVKAGQQIAEMGRSGASRDMLHFEIRRNGRPTDPLPLLPRR